jgi:oxygen-dependent protoporphyrinogen oxidase
VVVGGGVAGLTCAWRLRRAGHDVEVLEREAEAGGRMRSESRGAFRLDRGASVVASSDRNLHSVAEVLDLEPSLRPLARAPNAVLRSGRLHTADLHSPLRLLTSDLLSASARARLPRLAFDVLRRARRLDPLRPESAAVYDGEAADTALRARVGDEALDWLLAPSLVSVLGAEPERLSWGFGLLALRGLASGASPESFVGGGGLFTKRLAECLTLRRGCEVFQIETETDGARIRFRSQGRARSVLADAVVVALPGCDVARVCPKLTPSERGFFEQVRYTRGMLVHLLFETAPAALPFGGVWFPHGEAGDLQSLDVVQRRAGMAPPGAGLLCARLTEAAADGLWEAPDAAVSDRVLGTLARTPIGRLAPFECAVQRFAPMLPQLPPGSLRRLAAFLGRIDRSPRLAFAGDYLVAPRVEGAVTSGMRAATEVVQSLGSP